MDLEQMRAHQRHSVVQQLKRFRGKLVIDPALVGPLLVVLAPEEGEEKEKKGPPEKVVPPPTLAELVKGAGLNLELDICDEWDRPLSEALQAHKQAACLLRCDNATELARLLPDLEAAAEKGHQLNLYVTPRKTLAMEQLLREKLKAGAVELNELDLDLVPWDSDVLSMQNPGMFSELMLANDPSALYPVAKALMKLQVYFGTAAAVRAKGEAAVQVARLLRTMQIESADIFAGQKTGIGCLYLLDRRCDLLTPLLTQRTYEGMIDELMGPIQNRLITIDGDDQSPSREVSLTNDDTVFKSLRDLHFRTAAKQIGNIAKEIQAFEESKKGLQDLKSIRNFMRELPKKLEEKALLTMHHGIRTQLRQILDKPGPDWQDLLDTETLIVCGDAEKGDKAVDKEAIEAIEDSMFRQEKQTKVLRLMCLYSQTVGGLRPKLWEQWKGQLVQNYGIKILPALSNLEQAGLLRRHGPPGLAVDRAKRELGLVASFDAAPPRQGSACELGVVYGGMREGQSGVSPPLCSLLARTHDPASRSRQWAGQELLQVLPGPHLPTEDEQQGGGRGLGSRMPVVVCFIGGCTYGEISALRHLAARWRADAEDQQLIVLTTGIVSGHGLVESVSAWRRPSDFRPR
eukprot:Hpha_TRINITY_DN15488_c3_g2::TRINITY_DN15488_c3_g2_i2::g.175597::m.175597/K20182/VPS33; vacuolar protein sorting-associated protein 33